MNDIEHPTPQEPEHRGSRFSRLHTRTYEMELLVSGAVVFGLIRMPPIINRVCASYIASLDGNLRIIGHLSQVYLQLILYGLIAVFVLHLAMRGFWIGLLGLESVFPEGIRWDKVKQGPAMIKRHRARIGSLAQAVEKTDDLCSLIFSFGFLVIIIWVYFVVVLGAALALGTVISRLFLGGEGAATIFWIITGGVLGFSACAEMIDNAFGRRVKSGGRWEWMIDRIASVAFVVSPARFIGTTQLTLGSNTSSARVSIALLFAMLGLALVQAAGGLMGQGIVRIDSLTFFPDTLREQGVDPRHYRNLRNPLSIEPLTPTIQSDLVTGPYLKLVIPYNPRRHNPLLQKTCPTLKPLSKEGLDAGRGRRHEDADVREAAACLGSLFEIKLDGMILQDLHFDFTIEQRTALEGIVSFISVDGLENGRHELEILAPPKIRRAAEDGQSPDPVRHVLPFWL